MAMSHGCLIWVEGRVPLASVEPLVREHLAPLGNFDASVTVEHGHGATLVASAPPDSNFWFEHAEAFALAAAALAKAEDRRTWAVAGYAGSADEWWAWSFERGGALRWRKRGSFIVMKALTREFGVKQAPFDVDTKPFLHRNPREWKVAGTLKLEAPNSTWLAVSQAEAERWTGVKHGKASVWRRDRPAGPHGPLDVAEFVVSLANEASTNDGLTRRGLTCDRAWSPGDVFFHGDEVIPLPDGTTTKTGIGYDHQMVAGLPATREGKSVFCRWGNLCTSSTGDAWLVLRVVQAPMKAPVAVEALRVEAHAREQLELADREEHVTDLVRDAIREDDAKGVNAALRGLDAEERERIVLEVLELAIRQPDAFEALATHLDASQDARNRLLESVPWAEALQRGAHVDAVLSDGRTLLMRAETPDDIEALLAAGAQPGVKDAEGLTVLHRLTTAEQVRTFASAGASFDVKNADGLSPFASWLEGLRFATPSDDDLEVCRAFIEAKAPPSGGQLRVKLAAWKKKPHLKAAAEQLERWLSRSESPAPRRPAARARK